MTHATAVYKRCTIFPLEAPHIHEELCSSPPKRLFLKGNKKHNPTTVLQHGVHKNHTELQNQDCIPTQATASVHHFPSEGGGLKISIHTSPKIIVFL